MAGTVAGAAPTLYCASAAYIYVLKSDVAILPAGSMRGTRLFEQYHNIRYYWQARFLKFWTSAYCGACASKLRCSQQIMMGTRKKPFFLSIRIFDEDVGVNYILYKYNNKI